MVKLRFIPVILMFPLITFGQAPFPAPGEIKQFAASKTCVVLEDGNAPYNVFIKKAVDEYWKITPFEYIKTADFNSRRTDPEYSFIVLTQTDFEKDKTHTSYNFINLLLGKDVEEIDQLPELCAVPLSSAGEDDLEYGYKLGAILSFMQKHAKLITGDPSNKGRKYLKYYNRNLPLISGKTILVKKEDLSPSIDSPEKIKVLCNNRIEIVPEEEIIKAIREKTPGTLILHKVGPAAEKNSGLCFKMLIGTDDAEIYYYNQHTIDRSNPNGLLPADLKRIGKY